MLSMVQGSCNKCSLHEFLRDALELILGSQMKKMDGRVNRIWPEVVVQWQKGLSI